MLDVDLRLRRGDTTFTYTFRTSELVTGVFGASGAGKTTLLHLVAGLERPDGGHLRIGDETLFDSDAHVNVPVHRRRIGAVFQDGRLLPHLSVRGNLRYGRRRATGAAIGSFDHIVDLLELQPLLTRRVHRLSGGERQRVAIGRALLSAPRLLLLDEPLSSVDSGHRARILALIMRIRDELSIPMLHVSHDLTELLTLARTLLVIDDGHTVDHGRLDELATRADTWSTLRAHGPVNVMRLTVVDHDAAAGLTRFAIGDAAEPVLRGPLTNDAPGTKRWAAIRPEDVALSPERIERISIRNQVAGRIKTLTRHPDRTLAEIDIGTDLLVEISHETVSELNLTPGAPVHCLIKSNAITLRGTARPTAEPSTPSTKATD